RGRAHFTIDPVLVVAAEQGGVLDVEPSEQVGEQVHVLGHQFGPFDRYLRGEWFASHHVAPSLRGRHTTRSQAYEEIIPARVRFRRRTRGAGRGAGAGSRTPAAGTWSGRDASARRPRIR